MKKQQGQAGPEGGAPQVGQEQVFSDDPVSAVSELRSRISQERYHHPDQVIRNSLLSALGRVRKPRKK